MILVTLPLRQRFEGVHSNAAEARLFVTDAVADLAVDHETIELLVSELATNAIRHAGSAFEVCVAAPASRVRIEVADESPVEPAPVAMTEEGGFGLAILDAMTSAWGSGPTDGGKVVWFEVARARPAEEAEPVESDEPADADAQPVYSIGAASRLLGVEPSTLRAWESRYGVVVPARSRGGQRLYSRDQLDHLRFVLAQIAEGVRTADAYRLLAQRLESVTFAPASPSASMLVLLAERDAYAADLAEYFLRTEGYEVRIALDGEEGQRLHQQLRPQIAIVELLLGGDSGTALCRQLADDGVAVLAVSTLDVRDAAMEAGASAFLSKPLEPLQLVSTVRDLLGTSALGAATTPKGQRDRADR